jgi:hypothetical protein
MNSFANGLQVGFWFAFLFEWMSLSPIMTGVLASAINRLAAQPIVAEAVAARGLQP